MWRLASWGVAAVGAVTLAILANQYEIQLRRDQFTATDALGRQAQQLQQLTREAQAENRRLSQAIDTLNGDRDRLFNRVTSVEKGLESVTGSVATRQVSPPGVREAPPQVAAPITQPALPPSMPEAKNATASPDLPSVPARPIEGNTSGDAAKPTPPSSQASDAASPAEPTSPKADGLASIETAMAPIVDAKPVASAAKAMEPAPPVVLAANTPAPVDIATPVARTEFGVDIGTANSVDGLRALWRGLTKTPALDGLRPIIVVRERSNGLGMQLRLVAGPLTDAAAAARICATLAEGKRACETSVFDGQRLSLNETSPIQQPAAATAAPKPQRPAHSQRRATPKPEPAPAPKPEQRSEQQPPLPQPVEEAQAQAPRQTRSLSNLLGFSQE